MKTISDLPLDGLPPLTAVDHGKVWVAAGEALNEMKTAPEAASVNLHVHALELLCIVMARAYLDLARQQRPNLGAPPSQSA